MKKKIALLAGGYTGEYEVSLQTAATIAQHIDPHRYEVYRIVVGKDGWFYTDARDRRWRVDLNDFSVRAEGGETLRFDLAFIAIHGSPGEDGKLQGYFDLMGIPYTTCDQTTSALTMNKSYAKAVVSGVEGLNLSRSVQLFRNRAQDHLQACRQMRLPLFVKPNNGGSSIGMSKVKSWEELGPALEKAFEQDTQVLVEEFIQGREFSIGVFRAGAKLEALPCTEIVAGREFFDYEAKYQPGIAEEITPGRLEAAAAASLADLACRAYERLNCRGVVRMDFIQEEGTGRWFFIEVNTVPGQSENSILPRQIRASGRSLQDFYSLLIEDSLNNGLNQGL